MISSKFQKNQDPPCPQLHVLRRGRQMLTGSKIQRILAPALLCQAMMMARRFLPNLWTSALLRERGRGLFPTSASTRRKILLLNFFPRRLCLFLIALHTSDLRLRKLQLAWAIGNDSSFHPMTLLSSRPLTRKRRTLGTPRWKTSQSRHPLRRRIRSSPNLFWFLPPVNLLVPNAM
jgi:hypothetical protein